MFRYLLFIVLLLVAPVMAMGPNETKQFSGSKLVGSWEGQGGCDGDLVIRADKTFKLSGFGPGGDMFEGTWHVEWSGLCMILILIDTTPGQNNEVFRFPVAKIDAKNLKLDHAKKGPSGEYTRIKK